MKKSISLLLILSVSFSIFASRTKIKEHITEVSMGKYDEQELGTSEVRVKKLLSGDLAKTDVVIILKPRKGTANLQYKRIGMKERFILDGDAREALVKAYEQYNNDFNSKALKKSKKIVEKYGAARTKVEWGAFSYIYSAEPKASFGYTFIGKSPFFTVKIYSQDTNIKTGDVKMNYSGSILYFTRNQLKEIVDAISQDNISNIMKDISNSEISDKYEEVSENYEENDNKTEEISDYVEE